MSASLLSAQCHEGPVSFGDLTFYDEADHAACPGGHTIEGVLGGWVCSCPCHHRHAEVES